MTSLVVTQSLTVKAYDNLYGVEYDDVIDVAFESWINGIFSNSYTAEGPFRLTVSNQVINSNFTSELLGMKEGEVKPYITWINLDEDVIEYYDTTIVRLVKDSTPDSTLAWRIIRPILITVASLGIVIGGAYAGVKISQRLGIKGCSTCDNKATSKCSRCGENYCASCSSKGCNSCGSRQFVRRQ